MIGNKNRLEFRILLVLCPNTQTTPIYLLQMCWRAHLGWWQGKGTTTDIHESQLGDQHQPKWSGSSISSHSCLLGNQYSPTSSILKTQRWFFPRASRFPSYSNVIGVLQRRAAPSCGWKCYLISCQPPPLLVHQVPACQSQGMHRGWTKTVMILPLPFIVCWLSQPPL